MIEKYISAVDTQLKELCSKQKLYIDKFEQSLCYTLLNGGKRLRAALMLEIIATKRKPIESDYQLAASIEMMHAYSLIHDDLPAMDNATLRRGRPANHTVFGEDVAILAGDGLNTNAFYAIANTNIQNDKKVEIIKILSQKTGIYGMVLGQAADVLSSKDKLNKNKKWLVNFIHKNKTARFMQAVCEIGALLADQPLEVFSKFGLYLGVAYQIVDDYLDIVMDKTTLGKDKKDIDNNTLTYPRVYGIEKSLDLSNRLKKLAIEKIKVIDGTKELIELANFIVKRVT